MYELPKELSLGVRHRTHSVTKFFASACSLKRITKRNKKKKKKWKGVKLTKQVYQYLQTSQFPVMAYPLEDEFHPAKLQPLRQSYENFTVSG